MRLGGPPPGRVPCTYTPRTTTAPTPWTPVVSARSCRRYVPPFRGSRWGVTTGAWALPDVDERLAAVRSWTVLPDFASVNWHEDGAEALAGALLDRGVGVEAGLWNAAAVDAWSASRLRERCVRVLVELADGITEPGTEAEVERLLSRLPRSGLEVLLHGEGSSCWPTLRCAVGRGLATRIGLEDVLVLPDGAPAPDNATLVRAARAIIETGTRPGG